MNDPISARAEVDYAWYGVCAILIAAPFLIPHRARRYAMIPVALGTLGLLARAATDIALQLDRIDGFQPSRELSEAVADPDIARSPHLLAHLE